MRKHVRSKKERKDKGDGFNAESKLSIEPRMGGNSLLKPKGPDAGYTVNEVIDTLNFCIRDAHNKGRRVGRIGFGSVQVSMQAGARFYSMPEKNGADKYTEVELGYPSKKPTEEILRYAEEPEKPTDTVYGYVPIELVAKWILKEVGDKNASETESITGNVNQKTQAELRELLRDPNYLPTWDDAQKAFPKNEGYGCNLDWFRFCNEKEHRIFELINKEHLEKLTDYVIGRIHAYDIPSEERQAIVVEAGSGDGKLTHYLQKIIDEKAPGLAKVIATDSGKWEINQDFPVEQMDFETAISTHHPDIVIQSWLGYRQDSTATFRSESSVKEYILIGEPEGGCCGDTVRTWGEPYSLDVDNLMEDGAITWDDVEGLVVKEGNNERVISAHEADGFTRVDLDEISKFNICRSDYSPGEEMHSCTVAFVRDSTPLPEMLRKKLNRLFNKLGR